ncbi:MAG: glycoside hydrolase family 127 protein, partial [Delftia sp.]|nr:glycoside hydrolase family 127 protein [Delftia sp.]
MKQDYPIIPVPFTDVRLDDVFWSPRIETNRRVTIPFAIKKCEETGRVDNFARAGGLAEGAFRGRYPFDDSDVYKIIEGAAYTLGLEPDEALETYLDDLIAKIAAAQEDDGYLYTARTIGAPHLLDWTGPERWSNLRRSHELYNVGHLYEAAVAHYQATGKRALLDVALKSADLIARVFGPDKLRDVPGHQEIELGLVRLYRVTGEQKCLQLAQFFLDERGRSHGRELYGAYAQDHAPLIEQREVVGHAVRATYMYASMADVAALTGDEAFAQASTRLWEDVVSKKLHLTGGIGARRQGEAFGDAYESPNKTTYTETSAAIGAAMWNQRLFPLHGQTTPLHAP